MNETEIKTSGAESSGEEAAPAGAGTGIRSAPKPDAGQRAAAKLKANAYQAEHLGSGTFRISKPKRSSAKRRQAALKNRRRGARK